MDKLKVLTGSAFFYCHDKNFRRYMEEAYGITDIEISYQRTHRYTLSSGKQIHYKKMSLIINEDNGKCFIFDANDKSHYIQEYIHLMHDNEEILHLVKSQFNPKFIPPADNIQIGSYHVSLEKFYDVQETMSVEPIKNRKHKKLYFNGDTKNGRRRFLKRMPSDILHWERERREFGDYHRQTSLYKMILSLPGGGDLCHREIEAFALKTPVLKPTYENILADPLIPNFHYIAFENRNEESLREVYNRCINNDEYLQYIADNAYDWYMRNSSRESINKMFDKGMNKIIKDE